MNHYTRLRRWTAMTLALLLLTTVSPAFASDTESFVFYNGLTWAATEADVLAAEPGGADDYDDYTIDTYHLYYWEDRSVDGEDNEIGYAFFSGQLAAAMIYFDWDTPDDFAARQDTVSGAYGQPTETDREKMMAMMDVATMGAVREASVDTFAGWRLADGTAVYLVDIEGDISLIYFNEPLIEAMQTSTEGNAPNDPSAEGFSFHNGVTWDMSPEQMFAAEGVDADDVYAETYNGTTVYALEGIMVGFEAVEVIYYYDGDQMTIAGYYYLLAGSNGYADREAEARETFGEPTETDIDTLVDLFNSAMRGVMSGEYIDAFSGWMLADGTSVYLIDLEGDICLVYFNQPVLLGE